MKQCRGIFVVLSLAVLLAAPLAASGGKEAPKSADQPVKLAVWVSNDMIKIWVDTIAQRMAAKNPKFSLESTVVPTAQITEKVIGTFIAGTGTPDIFACQEDFSKFIKGDYLDKNVVDLKSFFPAQNIDDIMYTEKWAWNNKAYGLSIEMAETVYYYRKDVFDSLGIDPSKWQSWDDYIKDGLKLKQAKDAFMSVQDVASWNQFHIFAYQNGGGWYDKTGANTLDSKENIEALQLWYDFVEKHKIHWPTTTFWGPGTSQAFKESKVVGVIIPEWYHAQVHIPQLQDQSGKWRMAKLPPFGASKARTAHRGGTALLINKNSANAAVVRDYLTLGYFTLEGQREKYIGKMGQFPSYRPSLKDAELLKFEHPYFGNQKTAELLAEIAPGCPPYYTNPFMAEALDIINRTVIPEVYKGKAPAQALREAKAALDAVIKK
jgi:ABC-type glycerol-3-phosphate transport system substrate-binding protein